MSDLHDITRQLGESYRLWKSEEKEKEKLRRKFFDAATDALKEETPSQVIEQLDAESEEEALRSAQRKFPRHTTVAVRETEKDKWDVVLEENPELKDFSFVNKADGYVYQRVIAEGGPTLDDDGLAEEQPGLWDAITEEVTVRRLKPLDQLTPEQAEALKPYILMPRPQTRMAAPRKAKPEELELDE